MNLIYSMTEGDVTKVDRVMNSPWSDVMLFRLMKNEVSEFNKRLYEIKSRRNER